MRNALIARSTSSGQPSQTQWTLTSIVAGSSRTLAPSGALSGFSRAAATGSRRNVPSGSSTTVQPADAIRSRIASASRKSFAARACARCSANRTTSSGASGIAVSLDGSRDEQLGVPGLDHPILGPVQHQRRRGDLREAAEGVPRLPRPPLSPLPAYTVRLGGAPP